MLSIFKYCDISPVLIQFVLIFWLLAQPSMALPNSYVEHQQTDESTASESALSLTDPSSSTDEVTQLREQLFTVIQQLAETKGELELTRQEMNNRFDTLSATTGHPSEEQGLEVQCRSAFTYWRDAVGKTLEFLDGFDIHCHHGEFLRQWRMTWGEKKNKKAIRYTCCRLARPESVEETNLPNIGSHTDTRSDTSQHPKRHRGSYADWRKQVGG